MMGEEVVLASREAGTSNIYLLQLGCYPVAVVILHVRQWLFYMIGCSVINTLF